MENNIQIFICYYNFNDVKNTCEWLLTNDEVFANQTDQSYELASLDDLNDWTAATGQAFQNIITVEEGQCKWKEYQYIDFCGKPDYRCGYDIIWD